MPELTRVHTYSVLEYSRAADGHAPTKAHATKSQSEKRKSHLEAFNHKFTHQFHKIDEMEKEPAYKRKGLDVNSDVQDSPSRLSLDKDKNDDLQIRSNNSFSQMPR